MSDLFDDDFGDSKGGKGTGQGKEKSLFAEMFESAEQNVGKRLSTGDKIKAEIISISKDEVFVSTGTAKDGMVHKTEFLDSEKKLTHKVGDVVDLYVTQIKPEYILLSRKISAKAQGEDLEDAFDMMLPVEGRVTELCNGGLRVQIMGKTAFCPISQIDSRFVQNAEEYIGKKFEFLITQFEGGRNIVVSRRKLLDQQAEENSVAFAEDHKIGDVMKGVVRRLEKFGAFVEVVPGIDGLVHISEVSWSRLADPGEVLKIGDETVVKIIKMEEVDGKLKLSLSIKQAQDDPWSEVAQKLETGKIVQGKVTRCVQFGAFVELFPGVEGLIPMGEMSHTKRVVKSDDLVKPGQVVAVLIKDINSMDKRISLSLRDADGDPWSGIDAKFPVGKIVNGVVTKKEKFGLFVELEPGVTGLFPRAKFGETASQMDAKKAGDSLTVQVLDLNFGERRISLGHPGDVPDDSWKGFAANTGAASGFNSLAAQLKGLKK